MTLSPAIAITILNIGISFWAVTFCLCSDSRRYASISIRSPEIQYPRAAEDDNIALFCGSSLKFARFISNRIVLSGNPVILCRSARDIASSRPSGIKSSMFIASPIKTISIHTLHTEGDVFEGRSDWRKHNFNPHPPHGG